MVLIFGGAYQGKLAYTLERFGLADSDVYRCVAQCTAVPVGKRVIYELDKWIMALVSAGIDIETAVRDFCECNDGAIVICNDVTCGVVPTDPELRKWREAFGKALSEVARASDEAVRLFCGIPMTVK